MCIVIRSVFVYVYEEFIFECIYLGIMFINEHGWVFCFDYILSQVHIEKEKKVKKKHTINRVL